MLIVFFVFIIWSSTCDERRRERIQDKFLPNSKKWLNRNQSYDDSNSRSKDQHHTRCFSFLWRIKESKLVRRRKKGNDEWFPGKSVWNFIQNKFFHLNALFLTWFLSDLKFKSFWRKNQQDSLSYTLFIVKWCKKKCENNGRQNVVKQHQMADQWVFKFTQFYATFHSFKCLLLKLILDRSQGRLL